MKITEVHFEKLVTTGNYSNMKIGLTATVQDGEEPTDVLDALEMCVNAEIKYRESQQQAEYQDENNKRQASYDLDELSRKIEQAKKKWDNAKSFLEQHGVDTSKIYDDDPFSDE